MAHSDEESLGSLLEAPQPEQTSSGRGTRALLVSALLFAIVAVGYWSVPFTSAPSRVSVPLQDEFQQKDRVGETAVEPPQALEKNEKRERMVVERDLSVVMQMHVPGRQAHYQDGVSKDGSAVCIKQAERLFDDVVEESSMGKELSSEELSAFKRRFGSSMKLRCKDLISERLWLKAASEEFEKQKPVMTAAVVASINSAGLGFKTKMHDWLLHESAETFEHHLGLKPIPDDQKSVLQREHSGRQAENLPEAFRAELKWPNCKEEILRIHNQGHCGSCWAFGGVASIDARMCIASGGNWDGSQDILSRLHVTSCAPSAYQAGADGCQGGWPHWPMEMMAKSGIATSSCLPYYIGGEGAEHFEHQDTAPPCESHCQGGYSLPLSNDTFSSAGVAKYDWIRHVHGDPTKISIVKTAIYQEGPVAFAFKANHAFMGYTSGVFSVCTGHDQANHAVYTFGWGIAAAADGGDAVEYFEASNSWGTDWGADGHFRIHPRCMTDVTIAGTIESSVISHSVGSVDSTVPRDPDNEFWPWAKPDECPYSDGCVTDMEGAGNYSNNEECISSALNGKTIRVAEFDTEWGYDVVTINGHKYYGTQADELNGVVVDDQGIRFKSDISVRRSGFKLCSS